MESGVDVSLTGTGGGVLTVDAFGLLNLNR